MSGSRLLIGTTFRQSLKLASPSRSWLCSQNLSTSTSYRDVFTIQDESDFKTRVLESKKPVVVDFTAKWCGPCKMLMPKIETAIAATKEKVDLAKVDIDDNPDIAMEYGVSAVPSVLGFKNGSVKDKFVGLKDDDQVDKFVKNLMK